MTSNVVLMNFWIFPLQVKMTVRLEAIGISTVNRVTGCWFGQIGCPPAIGPIDAQKR